MKKIILFFLLGGGTLSSFAQPKLITCTTERNPDNTIGIIAESRAFGDYTVKITFSSLMGYTTSTMTSDIALATADRGRREILKITPIKTAQSFGLSYSYQYFPGRALRKAPVNEIAYLLPTTPGNHLRFFKVSSVAERLGQKPAEEYFGAGFMYKPGDTVCASRAGLVYDANGEIKEGEKATQTFSQNRNKISIQHKDGTLGTYEIMSPIQLLVEPGDNVYPGQPLAVFNAPSDKYNVIFSTYFLDEKKLLAYNSNFREPDTRPTYFVYVPLTFYGSAEEKSTPLQLFKDYTTEHPKEIVAAELSKKDKKKLGLQ
jgi:hypothetical protein